MKRRVTLPDACQMEREGACLIHAQGSLLSAVSLPDYRPLQRWQFSDAAQAEAALEHARAESLTRKAS